MGYGTTGAVGARKRKQDQRDRERAIPRRQCADPKRRSRLERNVPQWLRFYMGERTFPAPWADSHIQIIENAEHAAMTGTGTAVAAPRGDGKTTIYRGVSINLLARRIIRFPVLAGWIKGQADEAFMRWLQMLAESPVFAADYPEITQPFEVSTHNLALRGLTWDDTGERIGAAVRTMHKVIVLPDSIGAIAARSVQGDAKGLNVTLPDGTILRPDFLLLDDAQDAGAADKPTQVSRTIDNIENVFMGLAGPQKRLTTAVTCTVECDGDVSCHFLARPGWKTLRVPRIVTWPGGASGGEWKTKEGDSQRAMWDEWRRLCIEHGQKAARRYYRKHRKDMVVGMAVSWRHRFDKERDVDCYDAAMWDYYDKGPDVFARGQQNQPIDKLAEAQVRVTPDAIVKRAIGPARGTIPEGSIHVVAGADINPGLSGRLGARITWAAAAFQMHQSECIIAYGIHRLDMPKDPTPSQQVTCVYGGLNHLRVMLGGIGVEAIVYDARGWYDKGVTRGQALRYATIPLPSSTCIAIPAEGWPHQAYRPTHKTAIRAFEGCHMARDRVEQQVVSWLAWDSDWFNLQQLRAWLAAPGAPGSCILYAGHHDGEFLNQITTRAFVGMVQKHSGPVYDWARQPGNDDYGDCLAMCRVGAAYYGIGTGGQVARKKYVETRKCKVRRWDE